MKPSSIEALLEAHGLTRPETGELSGTDRTRLAHAQPRLTVLRGGAEAVDADAREERADGVAAAATDVPGATSGGGSPQASEDAPRSDYAPRPESAASELAQALAALVPALPKRTAENLRILLEHDIALPSGAELRAARLGLLIDLVSDGSGEVPSVEHYEAARAARRTEAEGASSTDELWPHASTLSRAYGHWEAAVEAAMTLAERPTTATRAERSRGRTATYSRTEMLDGLCACRDALGYWPTPWELREYGRLRRQQARAAGKPDPRIPDRGTVLKHLGSWQAAMAAARRHAGQGAR